MADFSRHWEFRRHCASFSATSSTSGTALGTVTRSAENYEDLQLIREPRGGDFHGLTIQVIKIQLRVSEGRSELNL